MRNLSKLLPLLLFFLMLQFGSCQKEKIETIENPVTEGTLTLNSPLTNLLFRVSSNDGDNDDFIDGSDCFSIKFPFSVIIEGTTLNLENEGDYQNIFDFIEISGGSLEEMDISYPITIIFSDYSEVLINDYSELITYSNQCTAGENETIDCIGIVYPLQFYTYNSETENTSASVFNNDKELNLYISGLNNADFLTIEYPLSVLLIDDSIVEVSSNTELENLINGCNNQSSQEITELISYLISDSWYVSSFVNDTEENANYCEFEFIFNSEGTLNVTTNDSILLVVGSWNVITVGDGIKMLLDFPDEIPFDKLNNDWNLVSGSLTQFSLESSEDETLNLGRNQMLCDEDQISLISGYLTTESWYVNYFFENEDRTSNFCEYEFVFNEDGTGIVTDGTNIINGDWYVGTNNNGTFIGLDFGEELPFYSIWANWDVIYANLNSIKIETECSCGGMIYLTFGRTPTSCNEDNLFLEQVLQNGLWYVSQYLDDGVDDTLDYYYYDLYFNANNTVTAIYGLDTINGTWNVEGNEGNLEVVLDFGSTLFNELNANWDVQDILIERVVLENNISGTNNLILSKL